VVDFIVVSGELMGSDLVVGNREVTGDILNGGFNFCGVREIGDFLGVFTVFTNAQVTHYYVLCQAPVGAIILMEPTHVLLVFFTVFFLS